jgi:hypothetical protein
MAIKVSTGLRNKMLLATANGGAPFGTAMNLGFIKLYGGTVPADADAAVTGTLLCTISNNNTGTTGLTFAATAASGTITKTVAEVWSGTATAGTVTHYRLVAAGDTGALSTTEARVQGLVSTAGADLNLSNTTLVGGAIQTVDYYSMALPTA